MWMIDRDTSIRDELAEYERTRNRNIIRCYLSLSIGLRLWKICTPDYACTIFF